MLAYVGDTSTLIEVVYYCMRDFYLSFNDMSQNATYTSFSVTGIREVGQLCPSINNKGSVMYSNCRDKLLFNCQKMIGKVNNNWFMFMVFNATFNNISVISWWSVLLVEETGVPGENHRHVASHWQTLSHNVVSSKPRHERDSHSQL